MLIPVQNILTAVIAALMTIAPLIITIAFFIAGFVLTLGNHQRGKELGVAAFIGGAIMLGSQTIAGAIHA